MLAYAAGRQRIAARNSSPSTMLMIVGGHLAVVALAMSAKFIIEQRAPDAPIQIIDVPMIKNPPPPPEPTDQLPDVRPTETVHVPDTTVTIPTLDHSDVPATNTPTDPTGPTIGTDPPILKKPIPTLPDPVRVGPRFATPASAVRPPYPSSKLDSQEEAALRLRLSINEAGRVVAVDPVGAADPAFLNAARRHLIAKWRYQPATVDGKAVASSTVITLRFELEG